MKKIAIVSLLLSQFIIDLYQFALEFPYFFAQFTIIARDVIFSQIQ